MVRRQTPGLGRPIDLNTVRDKLPSYTYTLSQVLDRRGRIHARRTVDDADTQVCL
jgi:hypothetical protein